MKILVTGSGGQLGKSLRAVLPPNTIWVTHKDLEITNPQQVDQVLSKHQPDCVINTAAYNQVDRGELEPRDAYLVNALGPKYLADWCAARDSLLVQISTDYVFGLHDTGTLRETPWKTTDTPGPISAYGISKLAGEYFVRSTCPRHFVVRTCGLYGPTNSPGFGNFVQTMLRLSEERDHLSVVNDQHCTPTSTADLATALTDLIQSEAWGLYHITNAGETTWFDLAQEIFALRQSKVTVEPISSAEYPARAKRPPYSVLDCSKTEPLLTRPLKPWQDALAEYLAE